MLLITVKYHIILFLKYFLFFYFSSLPTNGSRPSVLHLQRKWQMVMNMKSKITELFFSKLYRCLNPQDQKPTFSPRHKRSCYETHIIYFTTGMSNYTSCPDLTRAATFCENPGSNRHCILLYSCPKLVQKLPNFIDLDA